MVQYFITSRYRLFLIDFFTFFINLAALVFFSRQLADLAAGSRAGSPSANLLLSVFYGALIFLQPVGGLLKRYSAHSRNPGLSTENLGGLLKYILPFYFLTQLMFLIFAAVQISETFFPNADFYGARFAIPFFGVPALAAVNTGLVYFYFVPPKQEPGLPFLNSKWIEWLGDGCNFAGMFSYQVLWWYLLADPYFSTRPDGLSALAGKILAFAGMALFFYFPPRLFYLAEDIHPRGAIISMATANLPVLLRVLFGK